MDYLHNNSSAEASPIEPLLRTVETAKLLTLSIRKVQYLCKQGKLPHMRIDGVLRFEKADILRFKDAHRHGGSHE